ncbi:MAG: hypothetical protein OEO21_04305 [Candidatus Krumholzibacteria bacterium]|nr:hypothetical protein [Candidatus Krumholzibacteria bacterium]
MKSRPALLALLVFLAPAASPATTDDDLSRRVAIDGRLDDYAPDEWILDATTAPAELPNDSRWGGDADVRRVAATWDNDRLYLAVDAAARDATVMLLVAYGAGGVRRLEAAGPLRRAITCEGFAPNLLVVAAPGGRVDVARVDAGGALQTLSEGEIPRAWKASPTGAVALEVAIPWTLAPPADGRVRVLAVITGDTGSGAGDAAPDPTALLPANPAARATLDRHAAVAADADADGSPDLGVSPRAATTVLPPGGSRARTGVSLGLRLERRAFAPDLGEEVHFEIDADADGRVYVTCTVYSVSGRPVRTLYEDDARDLPAPAPSSLDVWNGRDRAGAIVPGGVYVVNVTWGEARGERSGSANASVAVVR